jgi:hypothetical protein
MLKIMLVFRIVYSMTHPTWCVRNGLWCMHLYGTHLLYCIVHPVSCILHPVSCSLHPLFCILYPVPCIPLPTWFVYDEGNTEVEMKCYGVLILNIPGQLGNRVAVRGRGRSVTLPPPPPPFLLLDRYVKTTGTIFPPQQRIFCFMKQSHQKPSKCIKWSSGRRCITYIGEVWQ